MAPALETPVIHRAAWLAPASSPPLANGAVLIRGRTILALGPYPEIRSKAPADAAVVDHGSAALIPALVNGHTHLELTGLNGKIRLPQESFGAWLRELLPHRPSLTPEAQRKGIADGKRLLFEAGTALCADVMNGPGTAEEMQDILQPAQLPQRLAFQEVLGFNCKDLPSAMAPRSVEAFDARADRDSELSMAAHSCYSTSGELIQAARSWCRSRNRLLSIHVAEHIEEVELLRSGTGFCREILEALGRWTPGWRPPETTPIGYLDRLGVLDAWTLLVHAVHVTEADWDIIAGRGCPVCFCPRSNHNLSGGRAAVEWALERRIPSALGTDSLASNTDLSLFAEAAFLLDHNPGLRPEAVFHMMTQGGATALKQSSRFGSLDPGRESAILAVQIDQAVRPSELLEAIISQGAKGAWQWATCAANS